MISHLHSPEESVAEVDQLVLGTLQFIARNESVMLDCSSNLIDKGFDRVGRVLPLLCESCHIALNCGELLRVHNWIDGYNPHVQIALEQGFESGKITWPAVEQLGGMLNHTSLIVRGGMFFPDRYYLPSPMFGELEEAFWMGYRC